MKLILLLAAPVVTLAAVEGVFRARAWHRNSVTLESAFKLPDMESAHGSTRFIDIIRPSPNDKLIYELTPNYTGKFKKKVYRSNSHGFRGDEYPVEAAEGMLTVLGIGASIMFGHGVANGEEYGTLLEAGLNEEHPERKWRFVNTAVPSYNVVMKVEALKRKGLQFDPDLVLLNVASNNLSLPDYIRIEEDPMDLCRSFILDYFRDLRARREETEEYEAKLAHVSSRDLSWNALIQTDPSKIPDPYRDLVGWEPFYEAMDDLKALSEEHGFEVVVFANFEIDLTIAMLDEARKRGFHVITLHEDLLSWVKEREMKTDVKSYLRSELVASRSNSHPSALQHRMAADKILSGMEDRGVIGRLLQADETARDQ